MTEIWGLVTVLIVMVFAVAFPLYFVCFRMLRSIRIRIESKIDEAMDIQNSDLAKKIKTLQIDMNEMKSEIRTLRTMAALVNRTPLPDCMETKQ